MTRASAPNPWLVIVLAAGRGTRMGGPKALMTVRGEPWWRVQARRLDGAGVRTIWVVSAEVDSAIESAADAPLHRVIGDAHRPMFHSVHLGLRAAAHLTAAPLVVFVLPIDVPAPDNPDLYARLAEPGRVAVPTHAGVRGHPVCLPWTWVLDALNGAIARAPEPGALRLDALIRDAAVHVPVGDPRVVMNLNTPGDVRAFEQSLGRAA